jgi:hypothetical protein
MMSLRSKKIVVMIHRAVWPRWIITNVNTFPMRDPVMCNTVSLAPQERVRVKTSDLRCLARDDVLVVLLNFGDISPCRLATVEYHGIEMYTHIRIYAYTSEVRDQV